MLTDYCEEENEQRMTVISISINQSRLSFDKGKVKSWDTSTFNLSSRDKEEKEWNFNKPIQNKLDEIEWKRFNSEVLLRSELNKMDSWVILKKMSKRNNEHNDSNSKILNDNNILICINDYENEIEYKLQTS